MPTVCSALRRGIGALGRARDAEVHELHDAVREDHDVQRLDVAVDDARLVDGREAAAELLGDLQAGRERERALLVEDVAQRRARHVLHREEAEPVGLAEIVRAHDVPVRDLAREPDLLLERLTDRGALVERLGQEDLDGDLVVELPVEGAVHRAHAALAERAEDLVAPGEDRARARTRERARRRVGRDGRGDRRASAPPWSRSTGLRSSASICSSAAFSFSSPTMARERAGERADLVAARLRQLHVEIPLADLARALRELGERAGDAPAHREGHGQREEERERRPRGEACRESRRNAAVSSSRERETTKAPSVSSVALLIGTAATMRRSPATRTSSGPTACPCSKSDVDGGAVGRERGHEEVAPEGLRRGRELDARRLAALRRVREEARLAVRDAAQRPRALLVERRRDGENAAEAPLADRHVAREDGHGGHRGEHLAFADHGRSGHAEERVRDPLHLREGRAALLVDRPDRSGRGGRRSRRRERPSAR